MTVNNLGAIQTCIIAALTLLKLINYTVDDENASKVFRVIGLVNADHVVPDLRHWRNVRLHLFTPDGICDAKR